MKRIFAVGVLLAAALLPIGGHAQSASGRPNILFIMTDDHAAHAIGAYGSRINETPNLDRLAQEGALHHKAPHRPRAPSDEHAAHFAAHRVPEPATFWDSYETRSDALRENQQRIAADLTAAGGVAALCIPADLQVQERAI